MSPTTWNPIRHVARVIIDELELEDVTPDALNPDMDLVNEVGIDSIDLNDRRGRPDHHGR